jgi:hypothetical protein
LSENNKWNQQSQSFALIYDVNHYVNFSHPSYPFKRNTPFEVNKKYLYNLDQKIDNEYIDCEIISVFLYEYEKISFRIWINESCAIFDKIPLEALRFKSHFIHEDRNIDYSSISLEHCSFTNPDIHAIFHYSSYLKGCESDIFVKENKKSKTIIRSSAYLFSIDYHKEDMNGHLLCVDDKIVFKANYEILIKKDVDKTVNVFYDYDGWPNYKALQQSSLK